MSFQAKIGNEPPPFETFEEEDADPATPSLLKA